MGIILVSFRVPLGVFWSKSWVEGFCDGGFITVDRCAGGVDPKSHLVHPKRSDSCNASNVLFNL